MAVYSMTGFGREIYEGKGGCRITVELGSVNRKQLDCNVSLPRELAGWESKLQACISARIKRGYIKGSVSVENTAVADGADLNSLAGQVAALRRAAEALGLADDLTASSLLRMPEFLRARPAVPDAEALWPEIEKTLIKALNRLKGMRQTEGETLERDLRGRLSALRRISTRIARIAPKVPAYYKKILEQRIGTLLDANAGLDRDHIAREVAVFADRCDVSEELTRLESHFEQAEQVLDRGGACGRTLDFICQELFREINTVGSKANNAAISRLVIDFKTALEAVREQVQNVE